MVEVAEIYGEEEEIKTALQVKIFGREKIEDNTFYIIRTWLIY